MREEILASLRKFVCWARGHRWLYASREACREINVIGGIFAPRICLRCFEIARGFAYPGISRETFNLDNFEFLELISNVDLNFAKKLAEPSTWI